MSSFSFLLPIFLTGSSPTVDRNNVVQWNNDSEDSIIQNMGYRNGRLLVEKEGYYYLYSKVSFDSEEQCSFFQHEVWKDTKAYGRPIRLMKSKRFDTVPPFPSFLCCCTCALRLFIDYLCVFQFLAFKE